MVLRLPVADLFKMIAETFERRRGSFHGEGGQAGLLEDLNGGDRKRFLALKVIVNGTLQSTGVTGNILNRARLEATFVEFLHGGF